MNSAQLSVSPDSQALRDKTIVLVKRHRASWIQLGQHLYSIYKDKHFKAWGYLTFEAYCRKELQLKLATATKLLKSYHFLEKEEPEIVEKSNANHHEEMQDNIPNYESVNLLRLAQNNKKIAPGEYADIKKEVFDKIQEPKEVRAHVKQILEEKEDEDDSAEALLVRRRSKIRRVVSMLKTSKAQLEEDKAVPKYLLSQIDDLVTKALVFLALCLCITSLLYASQDSYHEEEWFERAYGDLKAAQLLRAESSLFDIVCFHSHQAVEKAMKGFLYYHGARPERIHRTRDLAETMAPYAPEMREVTEALQMLDQLYVPSRYPQVPYRKFRAQDADACLEIAQELLPSIVQR